MVADPRVACGGEVRTRPGSNNSGALSLMWLWVRHTTPAAQTGSRPAAIANLARPTRLVDWSVTPLAHRVEIGRPWVAFESSRMALWKGLSGDERRWVATWRANLCSAGA